MTFLAVALGSLIGSFLGNVTVFMVIGTMAKKVEKKQLEELQKMQQGYLDMFQREKTRMENYAKMES
jgi:flagellar motor component MotA